MIVVKSREHYLQLLENNKGASVGHTLAAYMVVSRPGEKWALDGELLGEWRATSRYLKATYGETLTPDEVRREMGKQQ